MVKDMSEAKKYDRSYKEQSAKPALETGVKRLNKESKRLQEERDFLNEAAAFFAANHRK